MTASSPSGDEITASCSDRLGQPEQPCQLRGPDRCAHTAIPARPTYTPPPLLAVVDDKTLDLDAGHRELNRPRQARYRVGVAVHELDRLLVVGV
jgi:hypothetical protein